MSQDTPLKGLWELDASELKRNPDLLTPLHNMLALDLGELCQKVEALVPLELRANWLPKSQRTKRFNMPQH
jgi:hypothetical protein